MNYLATGSPGKECGTNKLPPTGRIQERSKGERRLQSICPTNLPESFSLESIFAKRCTCHWEGFWLRVIVQRQPGNQSHHHKTWDFRPHRRAALLGSLTLLLATWVPLPNKVSFFVSTCVSSDNSFPSVRQEPPFRPWKVSPFKQQNLPAIWSWASQPPELWEIIVCCLSQLVYGIFVVVIAAWMHRQNVSDI